MGTPKQLTAQNIHNIHNIEITTEDRIVISLVVSCEVNYGTVGINETVNVFDTMDNTMKDTVQKLYEFITEDVEYKILGKERK